MKSNGFLALAARNAIWFVAVRGIVPLRCRYYRSLIHKRRLETVQLSLFFWLFLVAFVAKQEKADTQVQHDSPAGKDPGILF